MKQHLALTGSLLAIAVSGWAIFQANQPGNADNPFPDGLHYLCPDHETPQGFTLSYAAFAAHQEQHWGTAIPCPECRGEHARRAAHCATCGNYRETDRYAEGPCPKCRTP